MTASALCVPHAFSHEADLQSKERRANLLTYMPLGKRKQEDGRGAWCDLIRIAQLFSEENNRITKAIMSRPLHVLMLDKRIKHFGKCVRVSRESRTCNTHWDRAPLRNRSIHCAAKFSTSIQPQQLRKNKSFVQRPFRITVRLLSTHLLKSTSTARWVTSAHGRALTIIAEGQHPATPCGHLCFGTHVSRCSQLMFAQFPVAFGLLTRTNNPGLHPIP